MSKIQSFIVSICKLVMVPILYSVLVTFLLCVPGDALPDVDDGGIPHLDKLVHVLMFAGLSFLWYLHVRVRHLLMQKIKTFTLTSLFFVAATMFGLVMEFIQRDFIPHRSFDWYDVVADAAGAMAGALLAGLIKEK